MTLIQIGTLAIHLHRKPIKNLHISVLPPDGLIRVSAPEQMTDTAIHMAVVSRIPWIKKQQQQFQNQSRQSDREMVSGECHYLWGKACRLNVSKRQGRPEVRYSGGKLHLFTSQDIDTEIKKRLLTEYYRGELKARIEQRLPDLQSRVGVTGVSWHIRKMKTLWGSCNPAARRICLNLELAKKPPECLDYILVHELVHLLERHHNDRFKSHLDKILPKWRECRNLLNNMPLASETWQY